LLYNIIILYKMNSGNIIAIIALVAGVGMYLSTVGGSSTNAQSGGKTFKRRSNKRHRRKTLSTKK
jgi:hypothetical protein